MESDRFDQFTRALSGGRSRRTLTHLLGVLAVAPLLGGTEAEAKKTGKKKKNKKPCAKAGQAPKKGNKKGKRCCAGLIPDGTGVCAPPPTGCTAATCAPMACGSVPDGCGGTLSCGGCSTPTPLCISQTCQPCDVCASGCPFTSVQAAINAASAGETIGICPGIYDGDLVIDRSLTLIGAGDSNGAGNTILQGTGTDTVVVITPDAPDVALRSLHITGGGAASFGGGILNNGGTLELIDCTVTANMADFGGGIYNVNVGDLILTDSTIADNVANFGGGISNAGGTVTLDAASRVTGNDADPNIADSGGGIYNNGTVTLSSIENVTDNDPDNCGGSPVPLCSN